MGLTVRNGVAERASSPPVQLREAVTELARRIEDLNWYSVEEAASVTPQENYHEHRRVVERARKLRKKSPLGRFACELLQNYVLGDGVSLSASDKKRIARVIDEFWENPTNRAAFTSHAAMAEFLLGAFTDGVQYLVLFADREKGTVEISTIADPLWVKEVVTDPNNHRVVKWYKVAQPVSRYDFKSGTWDATVAEDKAVWYRHWRNSDEAGGKNAPRKVEQGLIFPCKRGKGKFGESEMEAALDWIVQHKNFMEDRATLNRAAATIAWKKKRKGGPNDVAAEVERLRSSIASGLRGGAYEQNPPPATGATLVENEASSTEWMKTDTGGTSALADERILRMMVGSGMGGIPNHQFGDEAAANLATATAMNTPMNRRFKNWQKWLSDIIGELLGFVLEVAHDAGRIGPRDDEARYTDAEHSTEKVLDRTQVREDHDEDEPFSADDDTPVDWYIDIDFPPITEPEPEKYLTALKTLFDMLPQANPESAKLVVSMALNVLGVNDINQVLDRLFPPLKPGEQPQVQPVGPGGGRTALPAGAAPAGLLGAGQQQQVTQQVAESMAPERVARIVMLARAASSAITATHDADGQ